MHEPYVEFQYPLMTDIEERYELPEALIETCISLDIELKNNTPDVEVDKGLF